MNAFTQMADVLGAIKKTPEQRRQARNRRYYERNRDRWSVHHAVVRLYRLRDLLAS